MLQGIFSFWAFPFRSGFSLQVLATHRFTFIGHPNVNTSVRGSSYRMHRRRNRNNKVLAAGIISTYFRSYKADVETEATQFSHCLIHFIGRDMLFRQRGFLLVIVAYKDSSTLCICQSNTGHGQVFESFISCSNFQKTLIFGCLLLAIHVSIFWFY